MRLFGHISPSLRHLNNVRRFILARVATNIITNAYNAIGETNIIVEMLLLLMKTLWDRVNLLAINQQLVAVISNRLIC